MPKKIDPELKARALRLVSEHLSEYSSLTAASAAVAKQLGVGKESVRSRATEWNSTHACSEGLRCGVKDRRAR